ncbi:hypothetical protein PQX77_016277 [Marasmius sp. AFHP31]|nr:hypothetical protein PQX77_016277 [Marasmius sp. AFHP31]
MEDNLLFPSLPANEDHLLGEETVFYDTGEEDRSFLGMALLDHEGDSGTGSDASFELCWVSSSDRIGAESERDIPGFEESPTHVTLGHDEGLEKKECPTHGWHVDEPMDKAVFGNANGTEKREAEEFEENSSVLLHPETDNEPILDIEDIKFTNDPGLILLVTEKALSAKLAVDLEDARRLQKRSETTISELRARLSEAEAANCSLKNDLRGLWTMMGQNERDAQEEQGRLQVQVSDMADALQAKDLAVKEHISKMNKAWFAERSQLSQESSDLAQQNRGLEKQVRNLENAGKAQKELKRQLEWMMRRLEDEKAGANCRADEGMKLVGDLEVKKKEYREAVDILNATCQSEQAWKQSHSQVTMELTTAKASWEKKRGEYRSSIAQKDKELAALRASCWPLPAIRPPAAPVSSNGLNIRLPHS